MKEKIIEKRSVNTFKLLHFKNYLQITKKYKNYINFYLFYLFIIYYFSLVSDPFECLRSFDIIRYIRLTFLVRNNKL